MPNGGVYPDSLTLTVEALDPSNAMCQCWDGFTVTLNKISDGTDGGLGECEVEYYAAITDPCSGLPSSIRFLCSGLQDLEIDGN